METQSSVMIMNRFERAYHQLSEVLSHGWTPPLKGKVDLSIRDKCIACVVEDDDIFFCLLDEAEEDEKFGCKVSSRRRLKVPDILLDKIDVPTSDDSREEMFKDNLARLRKVARERSILTIDDLDGTTPAGYWYTVGYKYLQEKARIYTLTSGS